MKKEQVTCSQSSLSRGLHGSASLLRGCLQQGCECPVAAGMVAPGASAMGRKQLLLPGAGGLYCRRTAWPVWWGKLLEDLAPDGRG